MRVRVCVCVRVCVRVRAHACGVCGVCGRSISRQLVQCTRVCACSHACAKVCELRGQWGGEPRMCSLTTECVLLLRMPIECLHTRMRACLTLARMRAFMSPLGLYRSLRGLYRPLYRRVDSRQPAQIIRQALGCCGWGLGLGIGVRVKAYC